jgi:polygalacturonase
LDKLRKLILLPQILDPDAPNPAQPAAGVVDVQSLGTDSSGRLDNTTILQAAIDTLPANGTLYFPAGLYRTGSLDLKSDMTLYLADRAVLKGSDDHRRHKFHPRSNTLYFLGAESVRNLHIRGHGLIDANGHAARLAWEKERGVRKIPGRCLPIRNGLNLTLRSVTIRNSCSWSIHLVDADDVQIEGLKVLSNFTDSNGDGLDLDGCNGVRVENCLIYAEDDAISPKAAWSTRSPRNFVIRDCILWSQNATGIRLGSEARSAEFADMLFENIDVLRANTMVRIFNYDGADMHRITFRNLWVEEYTQHAQERAEEEIRRLPEKRGPDHTYLLHVYVRPNAGAPAGQVREVRLENVHAARLVRSALTGAPRPDGVPSIRDIVFRHCTVAGRCLTDATALKISANAHAAPPTVSCP